MGDAAKILDIRSSTYDSTGWGLTGFFFKEILLVYSTKAAWAYRVELARLVAIPETSG